MNNLLESKQTALQDFFKSMSRLRDEGILINKKDFTCQIGEWIVESIYNGKRATNGIQKGWDVDVNGKHIQVKAHAKATTNKNRWSAVDHTTTVQVDELVIVVFTSDYKLKEFYLIPWNKAKDHIRLRGKKKPRPEINWNDVKDYRQNLGTLPRQDIVQLFE